MLLSWIVFRERPTPRLVLSIALAVTGVGLLAFASRSTSDNAPLGLACGLAAAFGWAVGTVILKRARLSIAPIVSAGWQLVVAGVPIAVVAIAIGDHRAFPDTWQTFAVIGYITVVPMSLGNVVWFSIAGRLPATMAGLSTVLVPMVAMATGAFFLGEPLGPMQLLAMACCAVAMTLALAPQRSPDATA